MRISRAGIAISVLPSLLMGGLFWTLAFHIHHNLGVWPPPSDMQHGFSTALVIHSDITVLYTTIFILATMLASPVTFLICALVPRWRRIIPYFLIYWLVFALCIGLGYLAPAGYLDWWRDTL